MKHKSSVKAALSKLETFVTKNLNLSGKSVLKHRPASEVIRRTLCMFPSEGFIHILRRFCTYFKMRRKYTYSKKVLYIFSINAKDLRRCEGFAKEIYTPLITWIKTLIVLSKNSGMVFRKPTFSNFAMVNLKTFIWSIDSQYFPR